MIGSLIIPICVLIGLQVMWFLFVPRAGSPRPSEGDLKLLRRLRRIGVGVLVVGVAGAAWVVRHTEPAAEDRGDIVGYESGSGDEGAVPIYASQSKKAAVQQERFGGKFGVMLTRVVPWFTSQWQGRKLAGTLLIVSGAIFLACFAWARILTFPVRPEPAAGT